MLGELDRVPHHGDEHPLFGDQKAGLAPTRVHVASHPCVDERPADQLDLPDPDAVRAEEDLSHPFMVRSALWITNSGPTRDQSALTAKLHVLWRTFGNSE